MLSAFFPPYAYGGYENRVCDVMQELTRRGHEIQVLTTLPDKELNPSPATFTFPVYRRLHWTGRKLSWAEKLTLKPKTNRLGVGLVFLRQVKRDIADLQNISKVIRQFQPDLIYLGHILPLTKSLLPYLSRVQFPLVVDDGGKTTVLSYQERGLWDRFQVDFHPKSRLLSWIKSAFNWIVKTVSSSLLIPNWSWPANLNVFFNSDLNLRNFLGVEIPVARQDVIHSGLDLAKFTFDRPSAKQTGLSILVPGRIEPNKGQLDVVQLMLELKRAGANANAKIVGDRWNIEYYAQLESVICQKGLDHNIFILPMLSSEALIDLYHQADICFFPSYHQTGFSRIPVEAMACGSVVISYGNEGSDEIIENGRTGFLITPCEFSEFIQSVLSQTDWRDQLNQVAIFARQKVVSDYSMDKYVDRIEKFLFTVLSAQTIGNPTFEEEIRS